VVDAECGTGGVASAASVQTSSSVWKRAMWLLCLLPFHGKVT